MLPDGWRRARLDAVARRASGHTPNKGEPSYWNGGIKWVSLADSWRLDRGYIADTDHEISEEGIKNSSAVLLPAGTVVLSRDAGVGKSGVLAKPMAVSQHFIAWDCSASTDLHNWFLYHWLQREKPEFERIAVGSTIKTIGLPYFVRLEIDLPPLAEQQRIAEILSAWDDAIAATERLLANIRRQKADLLSVLLRLHARSRHDARPFHAARFSSIFERVARKNAEGNDNVLTISAQQGLISQRDFFSKSVASRDLSGYTLLRRGEFAYNKSYSTGYPFGAIKPLLSYEAGVVSSLYLCFKFRDGVDADPDFFRHYFEAGMLEQEIAGIAQEGARNHGLLNVGIDDFFGLPLRVPDVPTQRRLAAILNTAESEERSIAVQVEKLRAEKRAIMADLLTGKRRVRRQAAEAAP
jgi:type I restriction enzyme S subunit